MTTAAWQISLSELETMVAQKCHLTIVGPTGNIVHDSPDPITQNTKKQHKDAVLYALETGIEVAPYIVREHPELGAVDIWDGYDIDIDLVSITGGSFIMGDLFDTKYKDERQVRNQTVDSFKLATVPVTQGLWRCIMGFNPSMFRFGDEYPVEQVSWNLAQRFIAKLNEKTGRAYRLPTEKEWEFAARDGGYVRQWIGADTTDMLPTYAWFSKNSDGSTHPVGLKKPNSLGLYDMSGNVWEWCQDVYGPYGRGTIITPLSQKQETIRVMRGGSWRRDETYLRVSERGYFQEGSRFRCLGFRLAHS